MTFYYIILVTSVVLNVLACAYAITAARRLFVVDNNIEAIEETFVSFQGHVEALYETEMYYGDESIRSLIDHSKLVLNEIEKYDNLYLLVLDEPLPEGDSE